MANRDGIFQRKRETGSPFYMSYVDHLGRQRQQKLKGVISVTQAKAARALKLAAVEKAKLLGHVEPTKDSFAEYVPAYLKRQKPLLTAASFTRTQGIVEDRLKPVFGSIPLAGIRRVDVQRYLTTRLGEVSVETARKEYFVIHHVLQSAKNDELIPTNYADGVKLPKASAGRVRYLQPTELNAVLAECPDWLRPIVGLLAFTGMRRSEVLGLRWLDVDLKTGFIYLPQTKNGEGRYVPLNQLALDALSLVERGNAKPTDLVFSSDSATPENVSLRFLRACRKVGIADFRLHDLRHTAASWLRMQGADLHDVAKVLGHKGLRMTMRYAHLAPDHVAATVRRLDTAFAEVKMLPAKQESTPR